MSGRQQMIKNQEQETIAGLIQQHSETQRYIERYSEPGMDQRKLNAFINLRNWIEAQLAKRDIELIY